MPDTAIKSFLWVVPAWPFPPEDGASIARANLIKSLAEYGYEIDMLVISNAAQTQFEPPDDTPIGAVYAVKTATEHRYLKPFYYLLMSVIHACTPVVMLRFSRTRVRSAVNRILAENHYKWDAIVYDGLHVAAHQMYCGDYQRSSAAKVIIYRAHNVESDIWYRMAEQQNNFLTRFFLRSQAKRIAKFEKSLIQTADRVAAVSTVDYLKLKQLEPHIQGRVIPISFAFTKPLIFPESHEKMTIMFLGKLDWPPNKEGLIWFLTKVWPKVVKVRSDMFLSIAGSGNSSWMSNYSNLPNLTFSGKIQNIQQLYQDSCLVIVPIFYGSGTRVKIIEACHYGRPCLSTTLGAEGVGLEDQNSYFCANDSDSWVSFLINAKPECLKKVGENAFQNAKHVFDHAVARDEFISLLGTLS